jgi:hypothetical protein
MKKNEINIRNAQSLDRTSRVTIQDDLEYWKLFDRSLASLGEAAVGENQFFERFTSPGGVTGNNAQP